MSTDGHSSLSFIIREWKEDDCDAVMNLIMELAVYEKLEHQVELTAEILKLDGFGPRAFFKCLVAEDVTQSSSHSEGGSRGPVIGYALFFYKFSTFQGRCLYLEDIYVPPSHRGTGVGVALVKALAQLSSKEGLKRIDFSCLCWNKSSIRFYERLGAVNLTQLEEWNFFRIDSEGIKKLAES